MKLIPGPPPEGFRASIATTYDGVAAARDARGEDDWRWPLAERFLGMLRDEGRTSLLEIGAGVGHTSRWFADQGLDVTATDLSPEQVALCRAKGLNAHVRDMYDLGFSTGSFNAAWAMNCIHHIPTADLPRVLRGIAEVVAPGALVYLGVWGGRDEEGMPEEDFYLPPRFFSFRSDASLVALVEPIFDIESFETFRPEEHSGDELHMQSLFLRVP